MFARIPAADSRYCCSSAAEWCRYYRSVGIMDFGPESSADPENRRTSAVAPRAREAEGGGQNPNQK